MNANHRIRVLLAKIGLDAHDRGVRFVAHGLQQAGMEVIYLGNFNIPEKIVRAAVDEAVDVIGLSVHSGEYLCYVPRLMELLRHNGAGDVPLLMGGLITTDEEAHLKTLGVRKVFRSGATLAEIEAAILQVVRRQGPAQPP